jgi:hypothetical protein
MVRSCDTAFLQGMNTCQFCGYPASLVHVHGHYQCSVCGTNALPCCDGDNCHTNEQLKASAGLLSTAAVHDAGTADQKKLCSFKSSNQVL